MSAETKRYAAAPIAACLILVASVGPVRADSTCSVATTICSQEEIDALPVNTLANLDWLISLTPSGYSDFVEHTQPPFIRGDPRDAQAPAPIHEMFSGEWAAAVAYNGTSPMWLEKCMRYPDWKTPSNFDWLDPVTTEPTPNADGFLDAWSRIANPDLDITIRYSFEDTGTGVAMGLGTLSGPAYRLSDRYILHQTYEITNISGAPITGLSLYQFAHSHPANTETPTADIAYDAMFHSAGALTAYQYDLTSNAINSGLTDGYETGSTFEDQVNLSSAMMPAAHGLGTYPGHLPGDDGLDPSTGSLKPVSGLHCDVENDSLGLETQILQQEVAGALKFDLGDLAPDEMKSVSVMLALHSMDHGIPATSCLTIEDTGGDPSIRLAKGACSGAMASGPWDVVMGSLSQLQRFTDCGTIGQDVFDCTVLTNLKCLGYAHTMDRITLDGDAHALDSLYYLVRPSSPFSVWGMGRNPPGGNPLYRFFFTPSTAPDVDACDPLP